MKISRYNYQTYYPKQYIINNKKTTPSYNRASIPTYGNNNINFKGGITKNFLFNLFSINPIHTFKNFTKEEYLKLSEAQKTKLRKEFELLEARHPRKLLSIGEIHAYIADCIKDTFNKRFGENNYIVIPIGRSLSSIGKALSIKIGENNVINIPMSRAGRFCTNPVLPSDYKKFVNTVRKDRGLKTFKKYLKSHNLSRNDIETSGKNYILMDYCCNGYSLIGAEQFFKSEEIWGNKKNNIFAVDFLQLLDMYDEDIIDSRIKFLQEDKSLFSQISYNLFDSAYKKYATVGKAITLKDTITASQKKLNSYWIPRATKLVWFNLIDTIMTGKGDFKVKLKQNVFNDKPIDNHIEPWHNVRSQYVNNLTNALNEINKVLIKVAPTKKSTKKSITKTIENPDLNKLKEIHRYLCNCYKHNGVSSSADRLKFYMLQPELKDLIQKINSNSYTYQK